MDGISHILNRATVTERNLYLDNTPEDSANGFSPERTLKRSTSPIKTSFLRTRSCNLYPTFMNKYERTIPGDYESILHNLLLNAKIFASVKRSIYALGLP